MGAFPLEEFWFTLLHKNDLQELWHPEMKIIFLLQGTGRVYFPDLKTTYTLREKDIFVINSFEVCDFELDEEAAALSFSVSQGFTNSIAPELLKYRINCRSFLYMEDKQAAFDVLRQDLAKAFKELSKNEKQGVSCSKSSAAAILEDLKHYFLENRQNLESSGIGETLKSVTNYIQNHYLERITLEDLAEHTFLSPTYISRIFTRYFGISFTGYLELLRLSNATRLLAGKGTLSEVAENSGFPNVNAMIQAFKRYRDMTPGEYRRNLDENREETAVEPKQFEEGSELFASLLCYAEIPSAELPNAEQVLEVMVDAAGRKEHLSTHWKRLLNVGYARSLTDGRIQSELRYMQEKVGFEFLRIKGILDDDMCLFRLDMNGNPVMNYAYVDEGIDFILSVGAKPMIEMGFMPGILAKNTQIRSMRGQIISNPKDIEAWRELIISLMTHLVKRYGERSVEKWLFSPWVAPDFIDLGLESREEYSKAYVASYRAIRSVVPRALMVGPGCVSFSNYWSWYLEMCKSHECMPDIISFRSFAAVGEREEDGMKLIGNNESFPYAVSSDENFLAHTAEEIRGILKRDGLEGMPLIVEEWSNNIWQR
ncbi:MAG: helix-turn-helix domain-containing protein, partial [Agathobacter sp.]